MNRDDLGKLIVASGPDIEAMDWSTLMTGAPEDPLAVR